jgi:hypothetical protein
MEEAAKEPAAPTSTHDIRDLYLKRHDEVAAPAVPPVPDITTRLATASRRVWAAVQSRFPSDRRVLAGLGLVAVAGALLIGLSRYDVAPSINPLSGTTYNTAVEKLASAVGSALDWVGARPAVPVATEVVASAPTKKPPVARSAARSPIDSSRALLLTPLASTATVQSSAPAGIAEIDASTETATRPAPAAPDDLVVETSSPVYSPNDTDVSPPVAVRSPGIATEERVQGARYISYIEVLVSESGQVESARARQPATLGAALQSNTALSVVKTWRFRPARRNGQPVKYRTTVPFVETFNPAGTTTGVR